MAYEFKITRRVEFAETDMAGIVHFSNFFRYMEAAECAFFRSLNFSLMTRQASPHVGWPRCHDECDYSQPLRFEDEFEVHLLVAEKRARVVAYEFRFRKLGANQPAEVARGKVIAVCVTRDAQGKMSATPIPKEIADKI